MTELSGQGTTLVDPPDIAKSAAVMMHDFAERLASVSGPVAETVARTSSRVVEGIFNAFDIATARNLPAKAAGIYVGTEAGEIAAISVAGFLGVTSGVVVVADAPVILLEFEMARE